MEAAGASGSHGKALVFLAARNTKVQELQERLPTLTEGLLATLSTEPKSATAMASLAEDPMRFSPSSVRAYDATLELRYAGEQAESVLIEAFGGLGTRLGDCIFADLSAALIGEDKAFLDNAPTPLRYQYLMRRRHDFSSEQYRKRYAEVHAQFGLETPGIKGYHQFHVDAERSRRACRAAGFGVWGIDSVSELHIASMDEFLAAVGASDIGVRAAADEEQFVDRPNSVMFTSTEVWRQGR